MQIMNLPFIAPLTIFAVVAETDTTLSTDKMELDHEEKNIHLLKRSQ